jgi:predicted nucleic acid-binding protein
MIAADTSSLVAYFSGASGPDVERLSQIMSDSRLILPPVVVTELLSDPAAREIENRIRDIEVLQIVDGYWVRAGEARRRLRQRGLKARVADALIAQSCIDHDVPLITRDHDFRHFAKHCGLKLA